MGFLGGCMKHFILNLIRSIFMSISIFAFVTIVQLFINSDIDYLLTTLFRTVALFAIVFAFRWLSTRTGTINNVDELQNEFEDVFKFDRVVITVLGILSVLLLVVYNSLTYFTVDSSLEEKYPDAKTFIKDTYSIEDVDWCLVEALPIYVKGLMFAAAQGCEDLLRYAEENEGCTKDELYKEYTSVIADNASQLRSNRYRAIFSLVSLFSLSYCYVLSYRCSLYLSLKKKLCLGGK